MISGLATTAASMPVDIAKTRIQNMKMIDGKPEFTGAIDVLGKVRFFFTYSRDSNCGFRMLAIPQFNCGCFTVTLVKVYTYHTYLRIGRYRYMP